MFKNKYFATFLIRKLEASDLDLPIVEKAKADLLDLLSGEDDYTYLSIVGDTDMETVKVRNDHGTLLLERGIGGTKPQAFAYGACIRTVSPTIIAAIKDLVCNYTCCEGPCECEPVEVGGYALPDCTKGQPWMGHVAFQGSMPMTLGANGAPDWMQVETKANTVTLSGTPNVSGQFSMSVCATNCNGTAVSSIPITIDIAE